MRLLFVLNVVDLFLGWVLFVCFVCFVTCLLFVVSVVVVLEKGVLFVCSLFFACLLCFVCFASAVALCIYLCCSVVGCVLFVFLFIMLLSPSSCCVVF